MALQLEKKMIAKGKNNPGKIQLYWQEKAAQAAPSWCYSCSARDLPVTSSPESEKDLEEEKEA